ncbi:MAG: hypothetical protein ACKOB0_16135, partial [Chthoniobacterales bacterium]
MKRLVALLLLVIVSFAFGQELQKFENCRLVEAGWADGDSFPVKLPDGKEIVLRLYYVDCNEVAAATETDQRRVRDQSSYFGIDDHQVTLEFGRRAADEVKKLLAKPFTVQTAFATAPGRSAKPRTYGFITLADGRDLGEVLVGEGLARSYGVRRNTPDGVKSQDDFFAVGQLDRKAVAIRPACFDYATFFEFLQFLSERGGNNGEQQESDKSLHGRKVTQRHRPSQRGDF